MAGTHRAPKTDPRHLAAREPVPLARNAVAIGLAASAVTGPIVVAAPAAADTVATTPMAAIPAPRMELAAEETSSPATVTYEVASGDWLSKIAPRFGEDWHELYADNAEVVGDDPNLIYPGQVLRVPSVQGPSVPSVPTQPIPAPTTQTQPAPRHAAAFQAPLDRMNVTQAFKGDAHRGIDLSATIGTPGYAVADGTVLFSRPASGFGLWTVIRSQIDGQTVDFVYGHMNHLIVSEGDHVSVGDHVIDTGTNGVVTGPHLHFEVWIGGRLAGHPVDPIAWLAAHGVATG